jgi:nicotinate phosphoribosyltransferase
VETINKEDEVKFPHAQPMGLYTDMYQLTMAQGYFLAGRKDETASFDYFFRKIPFSGGYVVFAGLEDALEALENFYFGPAEIEYLREQGFDGEFLKYLKDFRFRGNIVAVREGEIVFPNEPVAIVSGRLIECQLVETLVLNYLNFQSLIASKASRVRQVAGDKDVMDFGLRRAHGLGGFQASRASYIGGADATSNVMAGKRYGIPISGTMAHSWIQSFGEELKSFRVFAENYPGNTILLVDTYNTLKSGVPNAIKVGLEMKKKGGALKGIRLDSGDLAYLSKKAREMLDGAGLKEVRIYASNQLDEYVIRSLNEQGAKIDGYGVGTSLVTGQPDAALDGVFKLSMVNDEPTLKISENVEKVNLPGAKKIWRYLDEAGMFLIDGVLMREENVNYALYHPHFPEKNTPVFDLDKEELLHTVLEKGERVRPSPSLEDIRNYCQFRLKKLPEEGRRFEYPHIYRVGISEGLLNLKKHLIETHKKKIKKHKKDQQ